MKIVFYIFDIILYTLQVVFLTLKLSNVIQWNWGLVLIPLFVFVGVYIFSLIVSLIVFFGYWYEQD